MKRGYLPTSKIGPSVYHSNMNDLSFSLTKNDKPKNIPSFRCYKDIEDVFNKDPNETIVIEVHLKGPVEEKDGYYIGNEVIFKKVLIFNFVFSYLSNRYDKSRNYDRYYDPKLNFDMSNTCSFNLGNKNTGLHNIGNQNCGRNNVGHYNTGDNNRGDSNTGYRNVGDSNAGSHNLGRFNIGDFNSGIGNSGHYNIGDFNTGSYNIGSYNSGCFNCCSYSNGFFNTKQEIDLVSEDIGLFSFCIMNKPSNIPRREINGMKWFYLCSRLIKDEYKNPYRKYITEVISLREVRYLLKIPNFDNEIFQQVTGWSLENGKKIEGKRQKEINSFRQMRKNLW